jgi:hypothetical protein
MVHRGNLYFTVGLPQSGKSTYCDQWVRQPGRQHRLTRSSWGFSQTVPGPSLSHPKGNCGRSLSPRVVIAGDDFRKALYGRSYRIEAEATVFAMMDVATRALLDRGFDVIIDETCTTEQTLLRYLRLDRAATRSSSTRRS